ncbi:hypothetical protein KGF54_004292 [Candida jiufengensis]|uniref:uncharacterized protein n=1 Tax=Candida jiufengensis TaxID=497108 RepID=UPI0022253B3A|nr:uncharacterized protein KGF54_004292 [Candida jiufengensis]KAI5951218.1 hypothetical protein KGF54_004292 [Candida jiufengensis]
MGSSASKQSGRKLAKTVTENATNSIKRSNVNPLQNVQQNQQQPHQPTQTENLNHHLNTQSNTSIPMNNATSTPDESLNQNETAFRANTSASFDPKFLHKKLKNQHHNLQSQQQQIQQQPSQSDPEGKDGGDPHELGTSTYDKTFVNSINQLGKQIKTIEYNPTNDQNALVLKQLRSRRKLFELGEEENRKQMEQEPNSESLQKTMVNPQTLTSILKDLKDPRVDNNTILQDYQLEPNFLSGLEIFQVPTNVVEFEEDTKEDEMGHKPKSSISKTRKMDYEVEDENENEIVDNSTYRKLKKRISIDD